MKKFITYLVLISAFTMSAQSLKGVKLGEKWTGKIFKEDPSIGYLETTLGNVKGDIVTYAINDGRVYMIAFLPYENIYKSYADNIRIGLQKKLGFSKYTKSGDEDHKIYTYFDKTWNILISQEYNKYADKPIKLQVFLVDDKLFKIYDKEKLARSTADF